MARADPGHQAAAAAFHYSGYVAVHVRCPQSCGAWKFVREKDLRSSKWHAPQCTAHRDEKPHRHVGDVMELARRVAKESNRHVTIYQEMSMYTAAGGKSRRTNGRFVAGRRQRLDLVLGCDSKYVAIEVNAGSQHQSHERTIRLDRLKSKTCPCYMLVVDVPKDASVAGEWLADLEDALRDLL